MPIAGRVLSLYSTLAYPQYTTTYVRTDANTCGSDGGAFYLDGTGHICILDSGGGWIDATTWKFIFGHEMGHRVSDANDGPLGGGYNIDPRISSLCQCSYVDNFGGDAHCMQSREAAQSAQSEGFAHFFSTAIFNDRSENNGVYVYPKESLKASSLGYLIIDPPTAFDAYLKSGSDNNQWMEHKCNPGDVDQGVELDWLHFYFELWTSGANEWSIDEMFDIWSDTTGNYGWNNGSNGIMDIVNSQMGSGSDKRNLFYNTGIASGVDHG
ncbi:MAG: hypothetical protein JXR91_09775 [Deltaproteobacteria bacterium]|nr:hypothetical protein [Deltaproteobacteria bacterium]